MNYEENQLANISYTDKDFTSMYYDMLDLAKQLTDKWDPSTSNESDPGVVLIKEGAFVADHLNYNIDKNVLEAFLPSATQESSVRSLVELNGYIPRYYISATGTINLSYNGNDFDEEGEFPGFLIPAFSLSVTNSDNSVVYTNTNAVAISQKEVSYSIPVIEGSINSLEINGSNLITLESIDDNHRLYFNDPYVAENGVYIVNSGQSTYWYKTNYLLTQPVGSKCYRIDYDSYKGVPYIEFPDDISDIIGNGLNVLYISTTGTYGAVSANELNEVSSLYTSSDVTVSDYSVFKVNNPSSIRNGKDPETINEMYQSFKKVVGTFDTLVSTKDYSNAIRTITDLNGENVISNGFVTDRKNDYNNSLDVITFDEYGEYFDNISLTGRPSFKLCAEAPDEPNIGDIKFVASSSEVEAHFEIYTGTWVPISTITYSDFVTVTEPMSPYDICIYALNAYNASDFIASNPAKALKQSFTEVDGTVISDIKYALEDYKTINHTYKDLSRPDDVVCFKNYAPLRVTINPYNKVSKAERDSILTNVYKSLSDNFNASKLEFGDEINYDELVSVMEASDTRIKSVRLEDIQYIPKVLKHNGTEESLMYSTDALVDMVAKNVLAGRLCLFEFDDVLPVVYGQVNINTSYSVDSIETEAVKEKIDVETSLVDIVKTSSIKYTDSLADMISIVIYNPIAGSSEVPTDIAISAGDSEPLHQDDIMYISKYVYESGEYIKKDTIQYKDTGDSTVKLVNTSSGRITITRTVTDSSEVEYNYFYADPASGQHGLNDIRIDIVESNMELGENVDLLNYDITPNDNEYVMVAYPNYYTDVTYPTYVNYRFNTELGNTIFANQDYILKPGDELILVYSTDGNQSTVFYNAGDVVKSNFNITQTQDVATYTTKTVSRTGNEVSEVTYKFASLNSGQQIEHRVLLNTKIDSSSANISWIVDGSSNVLFNEGESTRILNANEYLIYTNSNRDGLVIYGTGTKITRTGTYVNEKWSLPRNANIDSISIEGYNSDISWKVFDFSVNPLDITEMNILTIGNTSNVVDQRNYIKIYNMTSEDTQLDNEWRLISETAYIEYCVDGIVSVLHPTATGYYARTRLDININENLGQTLYEGQKITVNSTSSSPMIFEEGKTIRSSLPLNVSGGDSISLQEVSVDNLYLQNYEIELPKIYTYAASAFGLTEGDIPDEYNNDLYVAYNGLYKLVSTELFETLTDGKDTFEEVNYIETSEGTVLSPTALYEIVGAPTEKALISDTGTYSFDMNVPSRAEFKFNYYNMFNNYDEAPLSYIIPIFVNYVGDGTNILPITVELAKQDDSEASDVEYKVHEYNTTYGSLSSSMILPSKDMYLLEIVPRVSFEESSEEIEYKEVNDTLILKISVNDTITGNNSESVTLHPIKCVKGINNALNKVSLSDVLHRIEELISNSDKPDIKPYYIHIPSNELAIQDPDINNPNILWDKNNIVNHCTIAQIDIDGTVTDIGISADFDIVKSMRDYK